MGDGMAKKLTTKSKNRVLLISTVTISLIVLLIMSMFRVWSQILEIRKNKIFYSTQLKELQEEEEYLKVEAEKLQDPDYVARYAREQYLYSKDGEFNIRIN